MILVTTLGNWYTTNLCIKLGDEDRHALHKEMGVVNSHNMAAVSRDVEGTTLRVQREEVDKTQTRGEATLGRI